MRQGFNSRRSRSRNGRRQHAPPKQHTFDSNGPEVKVRGTASQVLEKYLVLARDATATGDRVAAENYYQHAEHYYRVLNGDGGGNGSGGGATSRTNGDAGNGGIRGNAGTSAGEKTGDRTTAPDQAASEGDTTDPEEKASA